MRANRFAKPQMTKAGNKLAFTLWLNGSTDDALAKADPISLSRSYGLPVEDVNKDIVRQRFLRSAAA
jgi:hypothetical protein